MNCGGGILYIQRADGMFRPFGEVRNLEINMRLTLAGTANLDDGALVIFASEGGGASARVPVIRDKNGNYTCQSLQCIYKKTTEFCEHVGFARDIHDSQIGPTEERKAQEKLEIAKRNLEKAQALVASIQRDIPSEQVVALPDGSRRIVLENE